MRVAFAVVAIAVLSGVAWLSFQHDEPAAGPMPAAVPAPMEVEAVPASGPASRVTAAELPASQIPYDKLTLEAKLQNKVIYTMSSLNEPMEVHPDGLVVIREHKMQVRYGDGREETRYVTLRARPKLIAAPLVDTDVNGEGATPQVGAIKVRKD
jgi:hypothetical protein